MDNKIIRETELRAFINKTLERRLKKLEKDLNGFWQMANNLNDRVRFLEMKGGRK